ncbi:MAG: UpxY family transcription antiterminator [Deltaproteobacteria bacterium]|nr:UpxY family transcription antiterminator [Deltaproteobacteria bacterium]MBW2123274.1 UpxY family transcription antiterminator [Deltaproteobacteria bacterium]
MDGSQAGIERPWYAIHTKPRHERKVNTRLAREGIRVFLPEIERWSRRKDRKKRILVPLFPGYLFVNQDLRGESRLKVIKTNGVIRILGDNGTPAAIPESQIHSIQRIVESKSLVQAHRYLKRGRIVRVVSGPLEGVEGVFLSEKGDGRLVVSIDLLHRSVSVAIDQADIEPV